MIPLSLSCLLAFLLSLACARLDESAACLPARVRETRKRVSSCFLFFHAIFPPFLLFKKPFFLFTTTSPSHRDLPSLFLPLLLLLLRRPSRWPAAF
jgi:hypothetical protein